MPLRASSDRYSLIYLTYMEFTSEQLDQKFNQLRDGLLEAMKDQGRITVDIMRQDVNATVKRSEDKILEAIA